MKKLISISIIFLFYQSAQSQERSARKDFLFENPVTKEQIKIEIGTNVALRFKMPNVKINGTILFLSDSSLILGIREEPYRQLVPFRNIASMTVIVKAEKRYVVRVTLKSGETLKGELIRITVDSLSIQQKTRNFQLTYMAASEIKSIRIRRKKATWLGLAIGGGTGIVVGGIIGYASFSPTPYCGANPNDPFCFNDLGQALSTVGGAAIGALAGSLVGIALGSASRKFEIEGDQSQFNLFANEFK